MNSGADGAVLVQLDIQVTNPPAPASTGGKHKIMVRPTYGYYGFRVTSKNYDPGFGTEYGLAAQAQP